MRKSQVLQIQKVSFKALSYNDPAIAFHFSEILAGSAPGYIERSVVGGPQDHNNDSTIQTIAIVPTSPSVPAEDFAHGLSTAIADIGLTGAKPPVLSPANLKKALSARTTGLYGESVLENYLLQIEDNAPLVLYLADHSKDTMWSKTCAAHVSLLSLDAQSWLISKGRRDPPSRKCDRCPRRQTVGARIDGCRERSDQEADTAPFCRAPCAARRDFQVAQGRPARNCFRLAN
jgi:hypothetical protein